MDSLRLNQLSQRRKNRLLIKFSKVDGAKAYKVKVGKKKYTTKKTTFTAKKVKGKKVVVRVAAVAKSSGVTGTFSAKKKVKVK